MYHRITLKNNKYSKRSLKDLQQKNIRSYSKHKTYQRMTIPSKLEIGIRNNRSLQYQWTIFGEYVQVVHSVIYDQIDWCLQKSRGRLPYRCTLSLLLVSMEFGQRIYLFVYLSVFFLWFLFVLFWFYIWGMGWVFFLVFHVLCLVNMLMYYVLYSH